MTVCIAVLCKGVASGKSIIVGASDRMLTAGDIEFEPPQTKIYLLSKEVVVMAAGGSEAQFTLFSQTRQDIQAEGVSDVGEIASRYAQHFAAYRREQAESALLAPMGLDAESFIKRQRELPYDVSSRLIGELRAFKLGIDAIIAGVDGTGHHLYVVDDPGRASCHDSVGFAAIGYGEWHALSQFMFKGYTKDWAFPRALLQTYSAKKRGEVAPGVGRETDMFVIFQKHVAVPLALQEGIAKIYNERRSKEDTIDQEALTEAERYVNGYFKKDEEGTAQEEQPETSTEAADEEAVSESPEAG